MNLIIIPQYYNLFCSDKFGFREAGKNTFLVRCFKTVVSPLSIGKVCFNRDYSWKQRNVMHVIISTISDTSMLAVCLTRVVGVSKLGLYEVYLKSWRSKNHTPPPPPNY